MDIRYCISIFFKSIPLYLISIFSDRYRYIENIDVSKIWIQFDIIESISQYVYQRYVDHPKYNPQTLWSAFYSNLIDIQNWFTPK